MTPTALTTVRLRAQLGAQHVGDLAQLHEAARGSEAFTGHARSLERAQVQVGDIALLVWSRSALPAWGTRA